MIPWWLMRDQGRRAPAKRTGLSGPGMAKGCARAPRHFALELVLCNTWPQVDPGKIHHFEPFHGWTPATSCDWADPFNARRERL